MRRASSLKQNSIQVKLNIQKYLAFSIAHLVFQYLGPDREYADNPLKSRCSMCKDLLSHKSQMAVLFLKSMLCGAAGPSFVLEVRTSS